VSQLRQREAELERLRVSVAVVTFQDGAVARNYVDQTQLSWPVLVDASRRLYHAYGMYHGRWWDLVGPAALATYFRLMAKGRRLRSARGADVKQLGGDVAIDPAGVVRYHRVAAGPADRPPVDELLAVVRSGCETS